MTGWRTGPAALAIAVCALPAPGAAGPPAPTPAATALDFRLRFDVSKVGKSGTRLVATVVTPADQFREAGDEDTAPDLTLSVSLTDARSGKAAGERSTGLHPVAERAGARGREVYFQGEITLDPGSYRTIVDLLDRRSQRRAERALPIEAPDFGRGLALSSIVIGRRNTSPGGPAIVPEPDAVFTDGETVAFAYDVYNPEHKGGATPDLDVQYDFLIDGADGPRPASRPVLLHRQTIESFEYSLPLEGWPEGPCRVHVRVSDNRTHRVVEREERFRIVAAPPPG